MNWLIFVSVSEAKEIILSLENFPFLCRSGSSENGLSCHDVISLDGKVHDPNRIDFLARYPHELKKAAKEVDLRGYFQWSLMDNFEWAKGYLDRFGLIFVDYRTQKRIWKDSAYWYQEIIRTNGVSIPM